MEIIKNIINKKNSKYLIIFSLILILTIMVSYGYFFASDKQDNPNTIIVNKCLSVEIITQENSISLDKDYPITDNEGLDKTPYTFTVQNKCDEPSPYAINLESLNKQDNSLEAKYVKVALASDTSENLISILSENPITPNYINEDNYKSYEAYNLFIGTLPANSTKDFEFREWIDYDTTKEQQNKTYESKINVVANPELVVEETPEIKFSNDGYNTLTGIITGNANSAKYCYSTSNVCTPDTDLTIASNLTILEPIEENNDNMLCANLDNNKTVCGKDFEYIKPGIEILATLNGTPTDTFPTQDEATPTDISCTRGATASFDFVDWAVEVDNVFSTTCTVDFKPNINQTLATYLKNKTCATTPTNDDDAKDCLVNENGYRYEGANPNNYVMFNNELWRIIGVFDNMSVANSSNTITSTNASLVKLIRDDTLDALTWDGNSKNDWTTSTLQTQLNNGYLNATDTTCNGYTTRVTKTCKFSEKGINSTSRNMIENVLWHIGAASSNDITTSEMYTEERGSTPGWGTTKTTWIGKVGLMYPSDYGYSVLESICNRSTTLYSYSSSECAGENWLYKEGLQWTFTPDSSSTNYYVFYVRYYGDVSSYFAHNGYGVRPSIYLKSSIQVLGGNGTYNFPYIIK